MSEASELVFPSIVSPKKWLSENSFNSVLRRMGYTQEEMTSHGFRSSASTILNEHGFNPDVIEAALGHQSDNPVRRAYNRAIYWPERVALMQTWADMLDEFRGWSPRLYFLHRPPRQPTTTNADVFAADRRRRDHRIGLKDLYRVAYTVSPTWGG